MQCDGEQLKVTVKRDDKPAFEVVAGYDRPDKETRIEVKDLGNKFFVLFFSSYMSNFYLATSEVLFHAGARKPSPDSFELTMWHSQNKQKVEDINVITSLKEDSRVRSRLFVRPGLKDGFTVSAIF